MDSTGASVLWAFIALQRGMLDVRGKLEEIGRDKIRKEKSLRRQRQPTDGKLARALPSRNVVSHCYALCVSFFKNLLPDTHAFS